MKRYLSTEIRARQVRELLAKHYEPGRQDRCKMWVYRNIIVKQFGISPRTFFRCLEEREEKNDGQLNLF